MRLYKFVLPTLIGLTVSACSETDPITQPQTDNQPIVLSAHIDEGNLIESRVADGAVSEGTYYLSFTNTSNTFQTVSAAFADGTGYPWIYPANDSVRALNWEDIQNPGTGNITLYLDNVPDVILDAETYQATIYNASENNANDIVWGSLSADYNTTPLQFKLQHRMASIRINIAVEDGNEDVSESISQYGATVRLLKVKNTATQFDRTNGEVTVDHDTKNDITLHTGILQEGGYTPTWIFPPQTFNDSYRPRLQIELNDGTTYTGALPETMFSDLNNATTAQTLAFNSGQRLTINVLLVQSIGEREILFLPAVVENWKDIGETSIISRQLGIYDEEDYADVVIAYNDKPSADNAILQRYGIYNTTTHQWDINIFAEIGKNETLSDDLKFKDNTNLNLEFNGWKVYGQSNLSELTQSSTSNPEEEEQP